MNTAAQIAALAVGLALVPCGFAAAHARRAPRLRQAAISFPRRAYASSTPRRDVFDGARAAAACPTPDYDQLAREGRAVVPNFAVQYGCVLHPEVASGSLGAMLRGENPAAGAIP
jgi:hypothetical protein